MELSNWAEDKQEYIRNKVEWEALPLAEKRRIAGYDELYPDEEFKPVVFKNGYVSDTYAISQYGKPKIIKTDRLMKVSDGYGIKGKKSYPGFSMRIPIEDYKEQTGIDMSGRQQSIQANGKFVMSGTCHQFVMNTWKPFHENLLPGLEEWWDKFPADLKFLIRDAVIIDHIDDNGWNNHIDNLQYTTHRDNNWHNKGV